jgi:hypothetical protein
VPPYDRLGAGPQLVAGATGFGHSTVSKVLTRAGISRPPRPVREPANRLLVEVLIPPSCVNEIFPVRESRLGLSSGWCRCSLFVTRFRMTPLAGVFPVICPGEEAATGLASACWRMRRPCDKERS